MTTTSPRPNARLHALVGCALFLLLAGCGGASSGPTDEDPGGPVPVPPMGQAPTILSASPFSGPVDGGTRVTIGGSDFAGAMAVSFGGVGGTDIVVLTPSTLEVTTPAHLQGDVTVSVSNADGSDDLIDGFAYVRVPPVLAGGDVQVDQDAGTPASLRRPKIACNGQDVHVVWSEQRGGALQDVFFQTSSDRGRTWLPLDVRLNTNTAGVSASLAPQICCDGESVYVCWMDNRNGHYEPFFNCSHDGGDTWLVQDLRISPLSGTLIGTEPSIACDGQNVAVTWADDRNNAPFLGADVWANRSIDGGQTWLASDARISSNGAGTTPLVISRIQIACEGSTVHTTWIDWRNGHPDVFVDRSNDSGATWQANDLQLDTAAASSDPALCADGSRVHVVWRDARNPGSQELFARSSGDAGVSFAPEVRVDHAPAFVVAGVPSVGCEGEHLYVTWGDPRNGTGADIWFNRSIDGGATFDPLDTRLNQDVGAALVFSYPPVICSNGGDHLHVAWADQRNGVGADVFVSSSNDAGATWPTDGMRVDTDTPGVANSFDHDIASAGAFFYVVWKDDRDAPGPLAGFDIRANGNGP